MKILIGTLCSGEQEFPRSLESLETQTYDHWDQFVIRDQPSRQAHDMLHSTFMSRAIDYDLFLKLDADMVFKHAQALEQIVALFREDDDLDHAELAVHDWFSDSLIMGLHVTTSRARWRQSAEQLFVDHKPVIAGVHRQYWEAPAPLVVHSPDPGPFQAYHFGVHRALKAFQFDVEKFVAVQARVQWDLLKKVWDHFSRTMDERLGLAVLGAEHVIKGTIQRRHYDYTNQELRDFFKAFERSSAEELQARLGETWTPLPRLLRRVSTVGPKFARHYLNKLVKAS